TKLSVLLISFHTACISFLCIASLEVFCSFKMMFCSFFMLLSSFVVSFIIVCICSYIFCSRTFCFVLSCCFCVICHNLLKLHAKLFSTFAKDSSDVCGKSYTLFANYYTFD